MIELLAAIHPVEWMFLVYFLALNGIYLTLNFVSLSTVYHYMDERRTDLEKIPHTGFEPPVSIVVPAFNEEATIVGSAHSLLQLNYQEYEVVIVNDGSTDGTLEALTEEFDLEPFPEVYRIRIPTAEVRTIYHSRKHPNLRVIDKDNGGKADALNAGINAAHFPLVCTMDADSILQRDSLLRVVQPFLEDSSTVAAGGNVRVANGCEIRDGFVVDVGLPSNPLALVQIVEYLRAFLFGRLGWSRLNSLLVISGAFGVFHRETVTMVGGFRTDTVGEDMELVVRMHHYLRLIERPYRITQVPDPICWTDVPETLKALKSQRIRWQRGLSESLTMNFRLLFDRRGGFLSWLAFPFNVVFEWLGPVIEVTGYTYMIVGYFFGWVDLTVMLVFFVVAVGLGTLLSVMALLLEEMSFQVYEKPRDILTLFAAAVLENFGYRQMISVFRLWGLVHWAVGGTMTWGGRTRAPGWQEAA